MFYSGYCKEELMPVVSRLAQSIASSSLKWGFQIHNFSPHNVCLRGSKLEAIRNKYSGVKFMKVADLPELRGEVSVSRNLKFFPTHFMLRNLQIFSTHFRL